AAREGDQAQDKAQQEAAEDTAEAEQEAPAACPAARKLMEENNLAASAVKGTGKDNRITKADVLAHLEQRETQTSSEPAAAEPASAAVEGEEFEQAERQALARAPQERLEQRVPMTRIRARIAERLLTASQNTAMLTTFNELDMKAVMDTRARFQEQFEKTHEVRLGIMSFFVKAAVEALKRSPIVNASIDAGDVVYRGYYAIGMAVSSPRGLLVPVLRDADQ